MITDVDFLGAFSRADRLQAGDLRRGPWERFYTFDENTTEHVKVLRKVFGVAQLEKADPHRDAPPRIISRRKGANTPWHYDYNFRSVLSVQVVGRKTWSLLPAARRTRE